MQRLERQKPEYIHPVTRFEKEASIEGAPIDATV